MAKIILEIALTLMGGAWVTYGLYQFTGEMGPSVAFGMASICLFGANQS